ncbi:MAG: M20/M25/M40 family metallo-hydrolase [Microbacterium sp.]
MTLPWTGQSLAQQTTELLREMIQNQAVNDGTPDSGHEIRQVRTLQTFFERSGLDGAVVEPHPGRGNLIVRIPGTEPSAPSLCLLGHTDVVPVEPAGWHRDPFAAELVGDVLWGRGAIDMLDLTAAYAVVTRAVATSGFRPRGDLVFAAVADEENAGVYGAGWLTENDFDLVKADFVLTESGGAPTGAPPRVGVMVGEKGMAPVTLHITGRPGHGSAPWGSQSALVIAAEVVTRLSAYRTPTVISPQWRAYADTLEVDADTREALKDPDRIYGAFEATGLLAGYAHASTHTTITPTVIRSGKKYNVIPGEASVRIDIRALPGVTPDDIEGYLRDAIGDLLPHVRIEAGGFTDSTLSPTDTPLFETLRGAVKRARPDADLLPILGAGGTDGRFFRERGIPAYGFGVLSDRWDYGTFRTLFHGHNERIDLDSIALTVTALDHVVHDFLGTDRGLRIAR